MNFCYGLLSGKYDSTKQRAVLLNGDRRRNYFSYTATMRMELLLTGQLVFTDAQFFDGLYFHWLNKNREEFAAFQRLTASFEESLAGRQPLFSIAIKCRGPKGDKGHNQAPDLNFVAVKTFCKQFQFSSIEDDELAKAVFQLSSDYSEKCLVDKETAAAICPPEESLEAYTGSIGRQLEQLYGKDSNITAGWTQYAQELCALFQIRANRWGRRTACGQWEEPFCMAQYLEQPFPAGPEGTYRQVMAHRLALAEERMGGASAARRYFSRIRDEVIRDIANRSKITVALDELERLNQQLTPEGNRAEVSGLFREFRQLMNERYNKTLAYQHGCGFLDLCDYTRVFDQIAAGRVPQEAVRVPAELLISLAELSWVEFAALLDRCRPELERGLQDWLSDYGSFSAGEAGRLKQRLEAYLEQLTVAMAQNPGGAGGAAAGTARPWNKEGTCRDDIRSIFAEGYRFPYYFVGGGSFEASGEGNEICVLCVDRDKPVLEGMAVLRLRLDGEDPEEDLALDTLLAPVCNPLNGGDLSCVEKN